MYIDMSDVTKISKIYTIIKFFYLNDTQQLAQFYFWAIIVSIFILKILQGQACLQLLRSSNSNGHTQTN